MPAKTTKAPVVVENPEIVSEDDTDETTETTSKGRTAEPFGRGFNLALKFHNDIPDSERQSMVNAILETLDGIGADETYSVHRKTRGEPNDNQQTHAIAPFDYDWPEAKSGPTTRGVRIPQGKLADIIRAFAKKNNVSVDVAAEMLADALAE